MNEGLVLLIKIVLSVLILPAMAACGVVFYDHIHAYGAIGGFFILGCFTFLLMFLFIYKFWGVYETGQKMIAKLFKSAPTVGQFISMVIPFYLTVILVIFFVAHSGLHIKVSNQYFMFAAGFAFAMHVVCAAQDMQQHETSSFKKAYLFMYCLTMVLMVCVTVLLLDLVFAKFSFPKFFGILTERIAASYVRVFDFMLSGK